ncbi:MAG: matrixin family metalloprotease [Pseudomonadota bacterium]
MSQPPFSPHTASGDNRIDALLDGASNVGKWGGPTGTGVSLTFASKGPGSVYEPNYSPLLEPERGQDIIPNDVQAFGFRAAVNAWAAVANINMTEVVESGDVTADIRFSYSRAVDVLELGTGFTFNIFGFAYLPQATYLGGDIWLDPDVRGFEYGQQTNGNGYFLQLHELGHALLGLTDTSAEPGINGASLSAAENTNSFTVMSYNASPGVPADLENRSISFPTTPMLYDILAAQHIYGPNLNHNAGNTNYRFEFGEAIYETIWDGGGIDAIDWSNQDVGAFINLNDGEFSNLGPPRSDGVNSFSNTLAIAFNVVIENAFGGLANDTISGNEAANGITGGAGTDSLFGQAGADNIYGNQGSDVIYGNTDNDVIFGGQDGDLLFGGQQDDVIYGNFGNDAAYGNFGNDVLYGGREVDALFGGQDNDTLFGNLGNDDLFGNKGDDVLYGGADSDNLFGATGNDILFGDDDGDQLNGGEGDDTLYGGDGDDQLDGSNDDDVLYGGDGADQLQGGNDDDTLYGGAGADQLIGGDGADFLYGGEGADNMDGGTGNDTFVVSNQSQTVSEPNLGGTDVIQTNISLELFPNVEIAFLTGPNSIGITGNTENNRLVGNDRANLMEGGGGNDTIDSGSGADTLDGGSGRNLLIGGFGDDVYIINNNDDDDNSTVVEETNGGFDRIATSINIALPDNVEGIELLSGANEATGNDDPNLLIGSPGGDLLSGRDGADTIQGGAGGDTIVGGAGDDILTGEGGVDRFLYSGTNLGADTITDYEAGVDLFSIDNGLTVTATVQSGADVLITLSTGDIIRLVGVSAGDIEVEDLDA